MKRTWMWLAALAVSIASIPVQGWAQERTRIFTRGTETITVTEITPDSFNAGVGPALVKDGVIYASTTDYLWISRDSGKTWVKRGKEHGLTLSLAWVQSIAAVDSGHLLVGGNNGVFKSTDDGETWERIFWPPPYGRAPSLLFTREGVAFIGSDAIFRSIDNGNTWLEVANDSMASPYVWQMTQTSSGAILAGISSSGPTAGRGVLRSTDNGDTWTLHNRGFTAYKNIEGLAAAPKNVYASVYLNGAWYSEDDGISWKRVEGIPILPGYSVAVCSSLGVFFGFDTRGTSKDGLWRSYGESWKPVPGFTGLAVEGITSFDEKTVVVCGTGRIFLVKFETITEVEQIDNQSLITDYYLHQNYPNPFNPSTTIEFTLPERALVTVKVMNILGQEVAILVAEEIPAGTHRTVWDASGLPSGIYFARLEVYSDRSVEAHNFVATKKMLLVK